MGNTPLYLCRVVNINTPQLDILHHPHFVVYLTRSGRSALIAMLWFFPLSLLLCECVATVGQKHGLSSWLWD